MVKREETPDVGALKALWSAYRADLQGWLTGLAEQDAAFAAARVFRPLLALEMAALRERARRAVQGKGPCWWEGPVEPTGPASSPGTGAGST